jgi:hypothetical protein
MLPKSVILSLSRMIDRSLTLRLEEKIKTANKKKNVSPPGKKLQKVTPKKTTVDFVPASTEQIDPEKVHAVQIEVQLPDPQVHPSPMYAPLTFPCDQYHLRPSHLMELLKYHSGTFSRVELPIDGPTILDTAQDRRFRAIIDTAALRAALVLRSIPESTHYHHVFPGVVSYDFNLSEYIVGNSRYVTPTHHLYVNGQLRDSFLDPKYVGKQMASFLQHYSLSDLPKFCPTVLKHDSVPTASFLDYLSSKADF